MHHRNPLFLGSFPSLRSAVSSRCWWTQCGLAWLVVFLGQPRPCLMSLPSQRRLEDGAVVLSVLYKKNQSNLIRGSEMSLREIHDMCASSLPVVHPNGSSGGSTRKNALVPRCRGVFMSSGREGDYCCSPQHTPPWIIHPRISPTVVLILTH